MAHPLLDRYLKLVSERQGTDLHLKVGSPPRMRVKGTIETLLGEPPLDKTSVDAMAATVLTPGAKDTFLNKREAECTYSAPGLGRFRVSAYLQRGSIAIILRAVTTSARSFEELQLPPVLGPMVSAERGLVLVAGPAASGVTTTLAAMVDHLNHSRACHIVTVEDPVEVLHRDDQAAISQRQVGTDIASVAQGVSSALRQGTDVVVIGNIDSLEVAQAARAATEAGCLVIAGVRAADVGEAINSVVNLFPDRRHARVALAGVLSGAVAIRLLPTRTGTGRVPAVEILRASPQVQALLMADEMEAVSEEMARSTQMGMQTLNQALADLLEAGTIDEQAALAATADWLGLRDELERRGFIDADDVDLDD